MRNKKTRLGAILLLGVGLSAGYAQETNSASGGDALGSGGSVSFSIGQIVYTTNTGTNGSIAQGVQQSYISSVITGIEVTSINLSLSAYPNPSTDFVTLNVENYSSEDLRYSLLDIQGKILESMPITDNLTKINMGNLLSETYILNITNKNKTVKSFKIIKN